MRAIQGAFPRLKDTIHYEATTDIEDRLERKLVLKIVMLLYNFRLEKVGLNQIQNVYMFQSGLKMQNS
jgi:hypothetical protein